MAGLLCGQKVFLIAFWRRIAAKQARTALCALPNKIQ